MNRQARYGGVLLGAAVLLSLLISGSSASYLSDGYGGGEAACAYSGTVAAHDGSGASGAADSCSRGDHKHADANRPADGEKAALAGTSGIPGAGNKFVTDADARNTNARTPTAHSHPISDVTNLQSSLDGKAASGHTHDGLAPSGGTTGQVLKKNSNTDYDYSWAADDGGGGGVSDGDKGDITVSGSGATWTVDNQAVTYSKIQNVTDARLLGRSAGSAGAPQEITVGSGLSLSGGSLTATGGGGSGQLIVPFHADAGANVTLTNQANADQFLGNSNRNITKVDLTNYTQVRLIARVVTASASANNPRIYVEYVTSFTTTVASYDSIGTSAVNASLSSATLVDTGWIDLAAGAIGDVFVTILMNGGNAAADPALGMVAVHFR